MLAVYIGIAIIVGGLIAFLNLPGYLMLFVVGMVVVNLFKD